MTSPNRSVVAMRRSGIRRIHELAGSRSDVINLTIGEPDLPTPAHVVEAACRALAEGATGYAPIAGYPHLRERLAERLRSAHGLDLAVEEIVVSVGAMSGLMAALLSLVEPGDGVLVPDPGWTGYFMMVENLGAEILPYRLDANFEPDLEHVEELSRRGNAKVLLVNTPANPTGAVFTRAQVESLVGIAERHDLFVVSDEAYDELVFDRPHVAPAAVAESRRVVAVYSFSKTYSMTGFRVGYVAAPRELAELIVKVQENLVGCAASSSQHAAVAALGGPQDSVELARRTYARRRDILLEALAGTPLRAGSPHGTLYAFVDARAVADATSSLAERLVTEAGVALSPGDAFGERGRGFLRVCLTVDDEQIRRAAGRITDVLTLTT